MQYTSILNLGNHILVRGIENGKRVNHRNPYKPTYYVKENRKKSSTSKWKTLEGISLEPLKFNNINESREFLNKYREVDNFKIYGNTFLQYAYISEFFGRGLKFDLQDVVISAIDIEVGSENGFPEPAQAYEPITAITLHIKNKFEPGYENGKYMVFGCGSYKSSRSDDSR